ncbi:MAG: insulinase family protein, partial [Bacteroidales bacterium]
MEYQTYELDNGIRLIHHNTNSPIAYCGMIVHTGSRDELPEEHGLAHFIEHTIFKGTRKRKAYHILSRLEDVGGELNAYTTKEETCIYASCLKDDFGRAVDLISDILFHSTFPEKELAMEKEVIIDEINSYKDNPSELIFDDFEELIFRDQPIGRNILGSPDLIQGFSKEDILRFITRNYHTDEMVFCSVGNIPFNKVKKLFEKYFNPVEPNSRNEIRAKVKDYHPEKRILRKNTYQSHCIIGNIAYDLKDRRRTGLFLLNNILGGQGLNSRLNLSLREKNGYAYNVESSYSPYFDTGVISIYFGTDKKNLEKSIRLAYKEFDKLKKSRLGSLQMYKAKRQMIGQLARSAENHETLMLSMAKSYLIYNKVDGL